MVAKKKRLLQVGYSREDGQALLEFLIMMPVVLSFVWYLIKVDVAINTSIVGQKHTRSQVMLKILNHRDYPVEDEYLKNPRLRSVYFMAVAGDNVVTGGKSPAPVVNLGMGINPKPLPGTRDDIGEAESTWKRQNVRIRTAFGLCTSRKPQQDGTLGDYCGGVSR